MVSLKRQKSPGATKVKLPLACLVVSALLADPSFAQQNTDLNEPGPFRLGKYGLEHDQLSGWTYHFSPSSRSFTAAVSAADFADGLSRATMDFRCSDSFAGRTIEFGVSYVLSGGVYPGDEYSLDLFNSARSGRPAAYNIGNGFVRTDHISFSSLSGDPAPKEYIDMTAEFWTDLQKLDENARIEIRFAADKVQVPYVGLVFPLNGFSKVVGASAPYCP